MRSENLRDGGDDKVIWKRNRDGTSDKTSRQRNSKTWWKRTTTMLLGVSFGNWDVIGCFIWDLFETSWRRTDGTSSLHPHETSPQHTNKMLWRRTTETSWRRSTETLLGVSFEMYLRCCWDVQRDAVTTLLRRLVGGWDID